MKFYSGERQKDATLPRKVYTEQIQTSARQLNLFMKGLQLELRWELPGADFPAGILDINIRLGNCLLYDHIMLHIYMYSTYVRTRSWQEAMQNKSDSVVVYVFVYYCQATLAVWMENFL